MKPKEQALGTQLPHTSKSFPDYINYLTRVAIVWTIPCVKVKSTSYTSNLEKVFFTTM